MLTAGIMLASKYRSLFLERDARYSEEAIASLDDYDDLSLRVKQLLRDLQQINAEAAADGMADQGTLIKLLGDTDEVKALFTKWWPPVQAMEEAAKNFYNDQQQATRLAFIAAHKRFLHVSQHVNQRFITLCLRAYQSILDQKAA
jgi:hypothetical protein